MKQPMTYPVSVLVPVRNERANIERCIRGLALFDDVVVIDSNSTDGTLDLARALGARVVQFQYIKGGPKKKNWALRNVPLRNEWVLIVDADEVVTPRLAEEIGATVSDPSKPHVGYYINRRFLFLNRWIKHCGYYPSWNLRLFRCGSAAYEAIADFSETTGDNEVHEHVLLRGSAGFLKAELDHYAFPSITCFVEKHNRYSSWEAHVANTYLSPSRGNASIAVHLRMHRVVKRVARTMPFADALRFFYHYFIKLGVFDGRQGYIFCRLLANYEFLIWAKRAEAELASPPSREAR